MRRIGMVLVASVAMAMAVDAQKVSNVRAEQIAGTSNRPVVMAANLDFRPTTGVNLPPPAPAHLVPEAARPQPKTAEDTTTLLLDYLGSHLSEYHQPDPRIDIHLWSVTDEAYLDPSEFSYVYDVDQSQLQITGPEDQYRFWVHVDHDGDGNSAGLADFVWGSNLSIPLGYTGWLRFARWTPIVEPVSSFESYVAGTCDFPDEGVELPPGETTIRWPEFSEAWAVDDQIVFYSYRNCTTGESDYVEQSVGPDPLRGTLDLPAGSEVRLGVDHYGGSAVYGETILIGLPLTRFTVNGRDYSASGGVVRTTGEGGEESIVYVALGDSYASGEGNPPYRPETDVPKVNQCHRSSAAWSQGWPGWRIGEDASLYLIPGRADLSVDRRFFACSGAETKHVFHSNTTTGTDSNTTGTPQWPGEFGQQPQCDSLAAVDSPGLVSLSIGGNDVGFKEIILQCIAFGGSGPIGNGFTCDVLDFIPFGWETPLKTEVLQIIDELGRQKLPRLYQNIKQHSRGAPMVVVGYPDVLQGTNCSIVGDRLQLSEIAMASVLTEKLNLAIKCASFKEGVHFVPTAEKFAGRGACSFGEHWIHGLRLDPQESFHPNARGQLAYAAAVREYIDQKTWPLHNGPRLTPSELVAQYPECEHFVTKTATTDEPRPKLGELLVSTPATSQCAVQSGYAPGQDIELGGSGFAPGASVDLRLTVAEADYQRVFDSVGAESSGRLGTSTTLPASAPTFGLAVLEAAGAGEHGAPLTLTAAFQMGDSLIDDSDGDGTPDLCDLCPADPDPQQRDSDGDGLGDACDPCPDDPTRGPGEACGDWEPDASPTLDTPRQKTYLVPASAHAPGAEDTSWRSDLVLHAPGGEDAPTTLFFLGSGTDNSAVDGLEGEVPAAASLRLDDLVKNLFGRSSAAGAVLIGSDQNLMVGSRTYNDAPNGTFGQYVPGLELREAFERGDEARLIQLTRNSGFRTNIGFANAVNRETVVTVDLRRANGSQVAAKTFTVAPYGYLQKNDIFGVNVDDGYAIVRSDTQGASFFTYASVVDNQSGDPALVLPAETVGTDGAWVAAAARVAGAGGTNWRTDLEVHNPGNSQVQYTIELLVRGQANPNPASKIYSLGSGRSVRYEDCLLSVFGVSSGAAALRVTPSAGSVMVASRTYNDAPGGTYGQFISGVSEGAGSIASGQEGRLIQLSRSSDSSRGFRTNLGFVNTSASECEVDVTVYDSRGSRIGAKTYPLAAFEHDQANDVLNQVGAQDVDNAMAVVEPQTSGCRVIAFASVVDNRSGDPVYVAAAGTGGPPPPPPAPTSAPTLEISGTTENSVSLNWNTIPNATEYRIYRGNALVHTAAVQGWTDSGLSPGVQYCYSVSGANQSGEGPQSDPVCATTSSGSPSEAPDLLITNVSHDSIELSWSAVSGATLYKLYRGPNLIYQGASRQQTDTGLLENSDYCYTVKASNAAGDGPPSSERCTRTLSGIIECGDWAARSSGTSDPIFGVGYGLPGFVAVGLSGMVLTSNDGQAWTPSSSGTSSHLYRVDFGAGRYVAVGAGGTILSSPNGSSWTQSASGTTRDLTTVEWVGDRFIATGLNGVVVVSSDGFGWQVTDTGVAARLNGAAYLDQGYAVVGSNDAATEGYALTSSDTVSWTTSTLPVPATALTTDGETGVAVGFFGGIATTRDRSQWTVGDSGTGRHLYDVISGLGGFVAAGERGTVLDSSDAVGWTDIDTPVTRDLYGVASGAGREVAVGDRGTILSRECQ
jgi:hypothetical protein